LIKSFAFRQSFFNVIELPDKKIEAGRFEIDNFVSEPGKFLRIYFNNIPVEFFIPFTDCPSRFIQGFSDFSDGKTGGAELNELLSISVRADLASSGSSVFGYSIML
jgi:hypothetical protein